jgi:hypothetical protein
MGVLIVRFPLLLDVPVTIGVEPITLIRYPVPNTAGMVATIVPEPVPTRVPIDVGTAKEPTAFDNCAVNVFPPAKAPHTVKGTLMVAP